MRVSRFIMMTLVAPGLLIGVSLAQTVPETVQPPIATPAETAVKVAQSVTLRISAKGSGVPIGKAEIKLGHEIIFSDPSGLAQVTIPPTGEGTVVVMRKGFERLKVRFDELRPPGAYDIRLYPGTPDDDVIIVRGKRNSAVSRTTVSIEEAAKIAPGGDPAQVVKLLPGVQTASNGGRGGGGGGGGGSQVVVQGSGPHDSRYYVDDLEVPFIFHSFGDLSVIPGEMMQSVDFDSAGFGAEYGNATGGIITLRTKDEIPERAKTNFVLNLPYYSGVVHTRPLSDSSSLTVAVRRSYIDYFLKMYLNEQNKRSKDKSSQITVAPYFSDVDVQYLKKSEEGLDKITLLGAYDGIKAVVPTDFSAGTSGQADINFYTAFADLGWERRRRLDSQWKYVTTPQIYYYQTTVKLGELLDAAQYVEKVRMPTHFTRRLGKDENLYLGVDPDLTIASTKVLAPQFNFDDPTFDPETAPLVKTIDTERYSNLASWAAVDQKFGDFLITPGIRGSYNGQTKKSIADPRLRARYGLTENHSLKAAVGQYSESPQAMQASEERGNSDLGFVKSNHYVLGLESALSEAWSIDMSVYYKTARDMIGSDPVTTYANKGSMRSRGFETMVRRNMTDRLFGWLSYTYSKTEERKDAASAWSTATYDQTHVLTLVGHYKLTGTWGAGGRYNYRTGSTYDTISGSVYNSNLDKYQSRSNESDTNNGRLPPYNSITAYFDHDFLYDTSKLSLRFGVEQYWYKPQVNHVSYNYNYTKTEDVTTLTTIPFLELKGEF